MSNEINPVLISSKVQGERYLGDGHDVTLRDLFAAFALAGYRGKHDWTLPAEQTAQQCYYDADAMLEEREKTK